MKYERVVHTRCACGESEAHFGVSDKKEKAPDLTRPCTTCGQIKTVIKTKIKEIK